MRLNSESKCLGELRESLMHLTRTRRLLLCYAGAHEQESDAKKESKVSQGELGPGLSRPGQHLFSQVFLFLLELRDLFLYCSLANKPEKQINEQQSEIQSRISTNKFKLHASTFKVLYIYFWFLSHIWWFMESIPSSVIKGCSQQCLGVSNDTGDQTWPPHAKYVS